MSQAQVLPVFSLCAILPVEMHVIKNAQMPNGIKERSAVGDTTNRKFSTF